jgi:hypothetical protein
MARYGTDVTGYPNAVVTADGGRAPTWASLADYPGTGGGGDIA